MAQFQTINPATGDVIKTFDYLNEQQIEECLALAQSAFEKWRRSPMSERSAKLMKAADLLEDRAEELAKLMALEMGKPVKGGVGEAKKCAWVCRFYAENAEAFMKPVPHESDGSDAFVRYDPIGPVLAIMPWNFPFWQVFRFAAPATMAGNVGILKHASVTPECAIAIEKIFTDAGYPRGVFQNMLLSGRQASALIEDPRIAGVTLTGSTGAGRQVAAQGGKFLKPMVMELGGSDPYIVLEDADVAEAAEVAATARCINSGQSCIAAKRFIVHKDVIADFTEKFVSHMAKFKMGDPMDESIDIGPQARHDLRDELHDQVARSIAAGAKPLLGCEVPDLKGAFYPASVLGGVKKGMAAADEEMFGPVAAIIEAESEEEAIAIANDSPFGLGASLWTGDKERALRLASEINAGAVFVNGLVKSDPRLPFGGIKDSGFGRELSREGMLEFMNAKTVWVK